MFVIIIMYKFTAKVRDGKMAGEVAVAYRAVKSESTRMLTS